MNIGAVLFMTYGAPAPKETFLAVGHLNSPFISAYPFSFDGGFGVKMANPTTLPAGNVIGLTFSKQGDLVALNHDSGARISVYDWSKSGFGTKYADPVSFVESGGRPGIEFSPAGTAVIKACAFDPRVEAHQFSKGTGFGTRYADPDTTGITANSLGLSMTPAGDAVATTVLMTSGPRVYVWAWTDAGGFGTRFANPTSAISSGQGFSIDFAPNGNAISVGNNNTPWLSAWQWSSSGFGTRYSNPSSPGTTPEDVSFSSNQDFIGMALFGSPRIGAYSWTDASGFGTRYSNPSSLPQGGGRGFGVSDDGSMVAAAFEASPWVAAYKFTTASGFGTRYANPGTVPTGNGRSVKFVTI